MFYSFFGGCPTVRDIFKYLLCFLHLDDVCTAWWVDGRTGDIFHSDRNEMFLLPQHPKLPKGGKDGLALE